MAKGDAVPLVCLPGIITPARDRYAPLLAVLGDEVTPVVKDLEVYGSASGTFDVAGEVAAVVRAADDAGFARFHFLGYSAGAAVGLALAARHGDRLLSLVVDEPPTDWSPEDVAGPWWREMYGLLDLPAEEVVPAFAQRQVGEGVGLPPPPGPAPEWMSARPAGIVAVGRAVRDAPEWASRWSSYSGPVLWAGGDQSATQYAHVRDRLAAALPQLRSVVFDDTHHLASAGVLRPADYADVLREVWRQA